MDGRDYFGFSVGGCHPFPDDLDGEPRTPNSLFSLSSPPPHTLRTTNPSWSRTTRLHRSTIFASFFYHPACPAPCITSWSLQLHLLIRPARVDCASATSPHIYKPLGTPIESSLFTVARILRVIRVSQFTPVTTAFIWLATGSGLKLQIPPASHCEQSIDPACPRQPSA